MSHSHALAGRLGAPQLQASGWRSCHSRQARRPPAAQRVDRVRSSSTGWALSRRGAGPRAPWRPSKPVMIYSMGTAKPIAPYRQLASRCSNSARDERFKVPVPNRVLAKQDSREELDRIGSTTASHSAARQPRLRSAGSTWRSKRLASRLASRSSARRSAPTSQPFGEPRRRCATRSTARSSAAPAAAAGASATFTRSSLKDYDGGGAAGGDGTLKYRHHWNSAYRTAYGWLARHSTHAAPCSGSCSGWGGQWQHCGGSTHFICG